MQLLAARHPLCLTGDAIARNARVLCAIPFHFRSTRLHHLMEVLRSLAEFQTARVTVRIFTNTTDPAEQGHILRLLRHFFDEHDGAISVHADLDDPWNLGWCHKSLIEEEFLAGHDHTHFIYLEDDMRVSHQNFAYFAGARVVLERHGLIPSFVRVEYNYNDCGLYATDWLAPAQTEGRPFIDAGGARFMPADNPYIAFYMLDRALAEEHVRTRSYDRLKSLDVMGWDNLARCAMGPTFENAPEGFPFRYVVGVDPRSHVPIGGTWVYHLPNNYANTGPEIPFGKIPLSGTFV